MRSLFIKRTILIPILLTLFVASSAQPTTDISPALSKMDYLKKSKKQKTAARVLLGAGGGLMLISVLVVVDDIVGIVEPGDKQNLQLADVLGYTGAAAAIGSIPLFIASGRNKRKAMSLSFNQQKIPFPKKNNWARVAIPSVKLTVCF